MNKKIFLFVTVYFVLSGCSELRVIDPCSLLTLDEINRLAPKAGQYLEIPPAEGWGDYKACTWLGPDLHNTFHLYYYSPSSSMSAMDFVKNGTKNSQVSIRLITVSGVGQSAAAALTKDTSDPTGTLKIFATQSESGTIGVRLWGIKDENDQKFEILKEIVGIALLRI